MEYSALDFANALAFIKAYRAMEQNTLPTNRKLIKATVEDSQFKHLFSSWAGRENDFGSFFLNLSYKTQAAFLLTFGIGVPGYGSYVSELEISPTAYVYATPPFLVSQLHELLKFFNNNGIDQYAVPGTTLYFLPNDRYGNSANWGKYILSLSMPYQLAILKQIALNSEENIRAADKNRAFMKNAIPLNQTSNC